ncbi:hypothetical protein GQ457_07G000730 [Hibiscus cannabinus]
MDEKEKSYRHKVAAILNEIEEDAQLFPEPLLRRRSPIHLVALNGSIIIDLFIVLTVSKRAMGNVWSNHLKKKTRMFQCYSRTVSSRALTYCLFLQSLRARIAFKVGIIVTCQNEAVV